MGFAIQRKQRSVITMRAICIGSRRKFTWARRRMQVTGKAPVHRKL